MKVLCSLLAAVLFAAVAGTPAAACTIVDLSPARQEMNADLIFTGTAVRAEYPGWMTSTGSEIIWTFEVDGVEKGRLRERIKVASALEEASCGYEFELGRRYRVLASSSVSGPPR